MAEKDRDFGEVTYVPHQSRDGQRLHLLVMVGTGGVIEFDLSAHGEYGIGRSPSAEICIDAPSVSRNHALLAIGDDGVVLSDLGSTNGTQVNGRQVGSEPVAIGVGDALSFGEVVAQLRGERSRGRVLARSVASAAFEARLADEVERSARFGRPLAIAAIEVAEADDDAMARAHRAMITSLRPSDVSSSRGPGRIDVLFAECPPEEVGVLARRLRLRLRAAGLSARIGVASFPGTVTVPDSLLLAAQLALRGAGPDDVAEAGEGARVIKIGGREIVVADPKMARLFNVIERVAGASMAVLVHGETGSGKEIVAEAIHVLSPRRASALVKVNCAAIPESLLESELYGHERGAFSGADRAKPGLFEAADGGTIFLDEIGDMPLAAQAKLLRVLEDGSIRRVGATSERRVDVRVVAATHQRLDELVAGGRFRQDLYFRLGAVVLEIPPLRERRREIPLLAARLAAEASPPGTVPIVSPEAAKALLAHRWPGNVRELRNVIGAAAVLAEDGVIEAAHLPPAIAQLAPPEAAAPTRELDSSATVQVRFEAAPRRRSETDSVPQFRRLDDEIRQLERSRIAEALAATNGNQLRAAELIGMPPRTFYAKVKQYGLSTGRQRSS